MRDAICYDSERRTKTATMLKPKRDEEGKQGEKGLIKK
jgi:hypothetical protein